MRIQNQVSSPARQVNRKAMGSLGAATGSLVTRLAVPFVTAKLGAELCDSFGPAAKVAGAVAGFATGVYVEFKSRRFEGVFPAGRMVGGMVGGVVGTGLGTAMDGLGMDIFSPRMQDETKGFSLGSLPKKLWDPSYTSHARPTAERVQQMLDKMEPGDVIVTNSDTWLDLEVMGGLTGSNPSWVHVGLYAGDGQAVDSLIECGVVERPAAVVMGENEHVKILRPAYQGKEQAQAAVAEARTHVGKGFDLTYNLRGEGSDDGFGCAELVWKSLSRAAPQLGLEPRKLLGKEFLTHDVFTNNPNMTVIDDTGSNFGYNYLSKFS
ncbi:MAG: hypothetical protein KC910_31040 [Candidatus Eremiobacteraeota bacterium]|nr:hypothetical protein [Candidatus Eremiobacteraeota bacterium]